MKPTDPHLNGTAVEPTDLVEVTAIELHLGPRQGNGGVTPSHTLLGGSLAVASGNNSRCPATDQRDRLRWDKSCDIGAFEVGAIGSLLSADGFESGDTRAWSNAARDKNGTPFEHDRTPLRW